MIAERGRYIVMTAGCIGCHATNGPQGPDLTKYLAGGSVKSQTQHATYVSRNLTPDKETGLGRRTDDEVKRVLRSGVFPDGHVVPSTNMPWGVRTGAKKIGTPSWYICAISPIRHQTPEPVMGHAVTVPGAFDQEHFAKDYGIGPATPVK
jgi:hypothetical protein